jgi:hypothetical protein
MRKYLLPPAAQGMFCLRFWKEHADQKIQVGDEETKDPHPLEIDYVWNRWHQGCWRYFF